MRGLFVAIAVALACTACATAQPAVPIDQPATPNATPVQHAELEGDVLALSFSGGGARAASFSLGALQALREMHGADGRDLVAHVRLVTSVSGGSIAAAYFVQHGEAGIDTFRAAYLDKNWAADLHTSPYSPLNWARAARGALNNPDRFADWLDREVFSSGHMSDLATPERPRLILNTTDLYNGTPFAFTPLYFGALCADLGSVRIADAVAASMAFPVAFKPILAQPYPDRCAPQPDWVTHVDHSTPTLVRRTARAFERYRDTARQKYLHLVDGGVLDNLGLSTLSLTRLTADTPYGPFTAREGVRVRRMTFLVINAEKTRSAEWPLTARGPTGPQTLDTLLDIQTEEVNQASYDLFRALAADWQRALRTWRCGLSNDDVLRLRGSLDGWDCNAISIAVDMVSFNDLPEPTRSHLGTAATVVTLPHDLVDALIAGGREATLHNPSALAMTH